MKISKFLLSIFVLSILFVSCNDDDEPKLPKGDYENGLIISGEGGATGSVYYVSDDYVTTESQIYNKVNGVDLGKFLQSIAFDNSRAFIVVDNQNTVTVVDRYTFEKLGEITTDLVAPKYMTISNGVGYVTNLGDPFNDSDDFIAVVDLDTYTVTSTIPVGKGPEKIVTANNKLYVSHYGRYSTNNIISVIDASNKVTEITVKDNPDEMFFDNSGNLIVLSEGNTIYDASWTVIGQTEAAITKISTSSDTVISELVFPAGQNPTLLVTDGVNMYYNLGSKIFKIGNSESSLPSTEFINTEAGYLYGLEVNNESLFILDANNFSEQSKLDIYNLDTKAKTISVAAPIGASKIYFN